MPARFGRVTCRKQADQANQPMSQDLWRFLGVTAIALVIGLLVGQIGFCLWIAALIALLWQNRNLRQLMRWLQDRKHQKSPDPPGIFEALCREIDYLHARHKRRKRKLSNVLKQFQDATTALPDATVILGPEGEIKWCNVAAETYLGVRWPDDANQRLVNLVRHPLAVDLLTSETPQDETVEIPSPLRHDVYLSLRVVPYTEDQRLFVARDITRLLRLSEMRRDFVANVSHELRTPLTVISGYIQTLRGDEQHCPETWKPILSQVETHAERMANVIRDLLLLSRLEQEDSHASERVVAVPEMLGRIHAEAQALSGERRHMFYLEIDAGLHLLGDEDELYSAFSNLVINAVRYTPERGIIRIRWYRDSSGAHLCVEDNGIGIPESHIPRITERFYRVDQGRSRATGGTGLGLAIVKHVLNRHSASLSIESTISKGSVFRCDFPSQRVVPAKVPDEASLAESS